MFCDSFSCQELRHSDDPSGIKSSPGGEKLRSRQTQSHHSHPGKQYSGPGSMLSMSSSTTTGVLATAGGTPAPVVSTSSMIATNASTRRSSSSFFSHSSTPSPSILTSLDHQESTAQPMMIHNRLSLDHRRDPSSNPAAASPVFESDHLMNLDHRSGLNSEIPGTESTLSRGTAKTNSHTQVATLFSSPFFLYSVVVFVVVPLLSLRQSHPISLLISERSLSLRVEPLFERQCRPER